MKKKPFSTDKKDNLNPMTDTLNYAAGSEGEDILEREDNDDELEEEPLADELVLPEEEYDDDEEDEDDDDRP